MLFKLCAGCFNSLNVLHFKAVTLICHLSRDPDSSSFFPSVHTHLHTLPCLFLFIACYVICISSFFLHPFRPFAFPSKKKKAWKFYIEKRPWCINVRENKTRRGAAAVVVVVMGADLFEPAPPSPPYSLTPYNPGVLPLGFSACFHIPYKARGSPRS